MPDEDARQQLLAHISKLAARPIEGTTAWRFKQQLVRKLVDKGFPIELAFDAVSQMTVTVDENFGNAFVTELAEQYAVYLLNLWAASHKLVHSIVHGTHAMGKQQQLTAMLFLRSVAAIR